MSLNSVSHLMAALERSRLLGPDQLGDIARELVPHHASARTLGAYLVEIGWLTEYQVNHLMAGEWDLLAVGPFQILDRLGEGGISEVFKAWDTEQGRMAALKVLRPDLTERPQAVREFRHEAACTARLVHPNIVKAYDAGQDGARHFFSMELIEGMDLERFTALVGPLPVEHACDYARQVAQGLQHAHQFHVVHRDIKPANLYLAHPPLAPAQPNTRKPPDPAVKIIDWGLARSTEGAQEGGSGPLVGTADYMAPEQIEDSSLADIRADIYSLGCTLYFLLTGQPVFAGTSVMQKIMQHREAPPPSLRHLRPDVPDELDALVQRLLAKKPGDPPRIPLLVVGPLRKLAYVHAGMAAQARPGSAQGAMLRPGSSPVLLRPAAARATALNLPRPTTQTAIRRPDAK